MATDTSKACERRTTHFGKMLQHYSFIFYSALPYLGPVMRRSPGDIDTYHTIPPKASPLGAYYFPIGEAQVQLQ